MLKKILLAVVAILACIGALVVAFTAWIAISVAMYKGGCTDKSSGYEKYVWYESGKRTDGLHGPGSDLFPASEYSEKFAPAGIEYDNYDRFLQCGESLKSARRVSVVRFAVASGFRFSPSTKYTDPAQVPGFWTGEPLGDYVPVGARQQVQMSEYDRGPGQSWLDLLPRVNVIDRPGRKAFIDTLDMAWLKDEPLDEAHLLGVWQQGWLFRSARSGYYVWIN